MNFKTSFKALFLVLFLGLFFASCEEDQEQIPVFTVLFDTDGGTAIEDQEVVQGELATRPTDPTKEGFTFVDWYVGEQVFDFKTPIVEDTKLTARWEEDILVFAVSFNSDGGTEVENQNVVEGELATRPTDPTKEGFTFVNWYVGEQVFDFKTPIVEDTKLTARWEEDILVFVVSFDSDGGTEVENQNIIEGELATRPTDPTKEGYNFVDWFNGEESFDFNTAITTDVALTAKWEIPTGETAVVYNTISQADFEAMAIGQHAMVKAELNYFMSGWAWGTETFLVDEKGNSSKDLYGHSDFGMFTFPLKVSKDDPMMGSTFVFNLVKDTYMSSPQLGFAYERDEEIAEGVTAYDGSMWNAPMRYGIEYFDEIIRGNVRSYAYTAETGVTATIGETVISFKTMVEDNDGNVTYEDLTEADLAKFDGLKGLNKYVYTITVDSEVISVLNDDALQVYDGLLAE